MNCCNQTCDQGRTCPVRNNQCPDIEFSDKLKYALFEFSNKFVSLFKNIFP